MQVVHRIAGMANWGIGAQKGPMWCMGPKGALKAGCQMDTISVYNQTLWSISMCEIIAISGKSGCGNTTVSTLVAQKLNYRLINYTFRQLADKHNIGFEELLEKSKMDPRYDKELDDEQIRLAESGKCVLASRLAIWLLRDTAFTVYLNAGIEKRIQNIKKREDRSLEYLYNFTMQRDDNDARRYKELYGIDINDYGFANLVIETENLTADEVVDSVINGFKLWKKEKDN